MSNIKNFVRMFFIAVFLIVINVASQSAPVESVTALKSTIKSVRADLLADGEMDAETKKSDIELLNRAETELQQRSQRAEQLVGYVKTFNNFEGLIAEAESLQMAAEKVTVPHDYMDEQAGAKLEVLSAEQQSLRSSLEDAESRQSLLSNRTSVIAQGLSAGRSELLALQESIDFDIKKFDGLSANKLYLHVRKLNLNSMINDLEAELPTLPARQQVIAARIKLNNTQLIGITSQIEALQLKMADNRLVMADSAVELASQSNLLYLDNSNPIKSLAQENVELATQLRQIALQADDVIVNAASLTTEMKQLIQSRETVEQVLATGLISDELVDVLRKMRKSLPLIEPLQLLQNKNKSNLTTHQLNIILWQNRLSGLQEVQSASKKLIDAKNTTQELLSNDDQLAAEQIVTERKVILEKLIYASQNQSERLVKEGVAITTSLETVQSLLDLLDRRLLWLPSRTGFDGGLLEHTKLSILWLTNTESWHSLFNDFKVGSMRKPALTLMFFLLPFLLIALRKKLKKLLSNLGSQVGHVKHDRYTTTPMAIGVTIMLSLPWPLLIGTVAGVLSVSPDKGLFTTSISTGLATLSSILLILTLFKNMCRHNGVFTDHFTWSATARKRLNNTFKWFNWIICISTFLFVVSMTSGISALRYGLALISFTVSGLAIAVFAFQFLKPKGGIAVAIMEGRPRPGMMVLLWPLLIIVPVTTALMPSFGFFDTAIELQSRVFRSGVVIFLIAVTYGICMRLLSVAHRRFKLRQVLLQREKTIKDRESSEDVLESGDAVPAATNNSHHDNDEINLQIRRVFYTLAGLTLFIGLWLIWSPLLPALGIIDDIVLWQGTKLVGAAEVTRSITLWNLIVSVLWIFGGFIAAKNIRGLLEIGVFERMKMNNGERYATVTIIGYFLVGIGFVIGLAQLGIDWSKLQWIVAALGVGLGFGLQEIVANFISGIIILFERPVRVGDTVTIGTLSGTVRNIKIRATTITDFDNHDVLLPNKSIITENVTNWTLNDAVTRLVIPIGVAYGSDVDLVKKLLMEIVTDNPDVLQTPPPTVFFMSHGESSLDFHVRIFVETPIKRMPVTHEINTKINAVLKENDIEIPFPQRTLHIVNDEIEK